MLGLFEMLGSYQGCKLSTAKLALSLMIFACLPYQQDAAAQNSQEYCRVADPTGTPLNVRRSPNGPISITLVNGSAVTVIDKSVSKGKPWAFVARDGSPVGWVFRDYLNCQPATLAAPTSNGSIPKINGS